MSVAGAWGAAAVYFIAPAWSLLQIGGFLISGILFFRAGTFIHEIVHMPRRQMVWFKRAWNLLLGIPMLTPWILYRNHIEHHNHRTFGTPDDGEYLPLAASPAAETLKYLVQAPLLPLFVIVRFGVLGPLSWLDPRLREWVLTTVSAAVSNPYYRKRFPKQDEAHLKVVEAMCFAWLVTLGGLLWYGTIRFQHLLMAYLLLAWTLGLNWVRNLAAHGYANPGTEMSPAAQVCDSINVTGQTWLTVLLFPVGLRYHALHHLFPALPYHNLGAAHRRLMRTCRPTRPTARPTASATSPPSASCGDRREARRALSPRCAAGRPAPPGPDPLRQRRGRNQARIHCTEGCTAPLTSLTKAGSALPSCAVCPAIRPSAPTRISAVV